MKQFLKSYHVFLPFAWEKLLLYLVYPLLLILLTCKLVEWSLVPVVNVGICCNFIIIVELLFDLIIFCGIAAKDTNKLEYLKTSVRGMSILRKSIIADGIRRAFSVVVIFAACFVRDQESYPTGKVLICMFVTLFLIELSLIVTRSFPVMGIIFGTISLVEILGLFLIIAIFGGSAPTWGICLSAALYLVTFVIGRMIIMRKARGSYYDGRD